jgi:NAD(P)-dependent dehydrogenase (short-subunit alcohol dehydrogenase family)
MIEGLFSLEGKVALVTGGTSGIGAMIARGYVESGARVYVASRKADACEQVAKELSAFGTCLPLPADLGAMDGVRQLARELAEREPKLHVLVNNAGANWAAPLGQYPESGWDKVMSLNLKAIFFLTEALIPALAAAASDEDPARVINIASIVGLNAPALDTFAYSASKAGVLHMTRVLAGKLARKRITVNSIAPGPFESKMMKVTLERFGSGIASQNPLGRIGRPEDMAGAAIYLASRAGSYVTGANLVVDGGITGARTGLTG